MCIRYFLALMVVLLLISCNPLKDKAQEIIKGAGSNGIELQKVLDHYQTTGEKEKLKAAWFLIANMPQKQTIYNNDLDRFYEAAQKITALKKQGVERDSLDKMIKVKIDSIIANGGNPQNAHTVLKYDVEAVSADYLIKNIDLAFKAWEKPWAQHLTFEQFCEYVLPYRIHNEPLSNWREVFYNRFIGFGDSLKNPSDPKELIEKISNYVYSHWTHLDNFTSYNLYPSPVEVERCGGGLCDHRYFVITAIMRSIGLGVSIDFTPQWTNYTGGHAWNVFVDVDGRVRPFNGGEDNFRFYDKNLIPMGDGGSICTKVYRQMYGHQDSSLPAQTDRKAANPLFDDPCLRDVTGEYEFPNMAYTLNVEDKALEGELVYLTTFNYGYDINSVACAKVKNGKADFGTIGLPAFYIPTVYQNGRPRMIHQPLVMYKEEEKQCDYEPDLSKKGSVSIYRKFPASGEFNQFAKQMVGCRIEGSDNADFSQPVLLQTIQQPAEAYTSIDFNNSRCYRYVRMLVPDTTELHLAELEFWGKDRASGALVQLKGTTIGYTPAGTEMKSELSNALDGNIRTNLNAKGGSWVGVDLGVKNTLPVSRVWYLPRNNYNEIEQGHLYELLYLSDRWVSLGRQQANSHYLKYEGVPDKALLLLKDLSGGRQERIFMYDMEAEKQVWW